MACAQAKAQEGQVQDAEELEKSKRAVDVYDSNLGLDFFEEAGAGVCPTDKSGLTLTPGGRQNFSSSAYMRLIKYLLHRVDGALAPHATGCKALALFDRLWSFQESPDLESVQCLQCIHDLLTAIFIADTLSAPIRQCMGGGSTTCGIK